MADNYLAGTAYMAVNGRTVMLVGEFSYRVTQMNVETLKGMDGIHGPKGSPEPGMIKAKLRDRADVSMSDVANAINDTIVVELANGKTVVGRNMWRAGEPVEVDADDASYAIQWEGVDVRDK